MTNLWIDLPKEKTREILDRAVASGMLKREFVEFILSEEGDITNADCSLDEKRGFGVSKSDA
jgi:hypothetical protein